MQELKGKVVAITGASGGIGEATALRLGRAGVKLVLGARRLDRLEAVAAEIVAAGGEAACMRLDVRRREEVSALADLARSRFGRLDVMIANAGVGPLSPLDDLRVDDWDLMIDVNIKGVLYAIAASLPIFRAQGQGHFVAVASTSGLKTTPNMAVYSGTKFAVRAICEGLRQEAGEKLRVTIISPGFVNTPFAEGAPDERIRAPIVAARDAFAMPPDAVARAIAYAIAETSGVDVGEIVIRPTAQG